MKRLDIPKSTFIGGYYMSDDVCTKMKDLFFAHPQYVKPTKMRGDVKKCTEFAINPNTNCFHPIDSYIDELVECTKQYIDEFIMPNTPNTSLQFRIAEDFNIQHYEIGEGFYKWHYERMFDDNMSWRRSLVFMTYLNDVPDGGTEFAHQKCEVKARKNLTLIWPADWTHTHRGVISQTKEKTIITGWLSVYNPVPTDWPLPRPAGYENES